MTFCRVLPLIFFWLLCPEGVAGADTLDLSAARATLAKPTAAASKAEAEGIDTTREKITITTARKPPAGIAPDVTRSCILPAAGFAIATALRAPTKSPRSRQAAQKQPSSSPRSRTPVLLWVVLT